MLIIRTLIFIAAVISLLLFYASNQFGGDIKLLIQVGALFNFAICAKNYSLTFR